MIKINVVHHGFHYQKFAHAEQSQVRTVEFKDLQKVP